MKRTTFFGIVALAVAIAWSVFLVWSMSASVGSAEDPRINTVATLEGSEEPAAAVATPSLPQTPAPVPEQKEAAPSYISDAVPLSAELQEVLHDACEASGVPYEIGLGLIEVESTFDPAAINQNSGCYGLCQLHPDYFPSNLSPAENIRAGMECLGSHIERYGGDLDAALTAYNAGHDTGNRWYAGQVRQAAEKWGGQ